MSHSHLTGLSHALLAPDFTPHVSDLAAGFYSQTALFRLRGVDVLGLGEIGSHLRRSFLGALGRGASIEARTNQPCPWEPPCALDVFCREQLRGPRGDGLPKPFVIGVWLQDGELVIALRIFGMANDWFLLATEAMVYGMREILPWKKLFPEISRLPEIVSREVQIDFLRPAPENCGNVQLKFHAPIDCGGGDPRDRPYSLLSRLLRRVDGISRWNGLAFEDESGRAFASFVRSLHYDVSGLRHGYHSSPNVKGQARVKSVLTGHLRVEGDISPVWPVLAMGELCHLGRGAVEGMGAYKLSAG